MSKDQIDINIQLRDATRDAALTRTTMTATESELFDALTALDDLIQVIYQGAHRFVVISRLHLPYSFSSSSLSTEPNSHWDIHLGHADKARWWRSRWKEEDIRHAVGSSASTTLIEAFADGVVKSVVSGELYVSGVSDPMAEDGIKVCFGGLRKTSNFTRVAS